MKRFFGLRAVYGIVGLLYSDHVLGGTAECLADVSAYGLPVIGEFDGENAYSNGGGAYSCQCVEFAARASGVSRLTATSGVGANCAYSAYTYLPSVDSNYTAYPNGGSTAPSTGDIIVWSGTDGVGHVGIINRGYDGSSTIEVVDQNRSSGTGPTDGYMVCSISSSAVYSVNCYPLLGYSYTLLGWLHDARRDACTTSTYTYSINMVTVEPNTTDYTIYGYAEMSTGDSTTFTSAGSMRSNTGTISTHLAWLSGDVDGDGWDDVVEISVTSSYTYAYVYLTNGYGGIDAAATWVTTTVGAIDAFLEDMDNDGDADLILGYQNSDGTEKWKTYTSTGSSFGGMTNGTIWSSSFGKTSDIFIVGDFKGNGKGELLCGREADGTNDYTFSSLMNWKRLSSTKVVSTVASSYGYSGDQFLAADMNADGNDELVRVDLYDNTVSIYMIQYSSTSSTFSSASKLSTDVGGTDGEYAIYPIDYMDAYPDLMRINTSGELYMSRSSGGTSVESQSSQHIMISGMPSGIDYLFGNFGEYTVTVCE